MERITMHVLVVEDDARLAEALARILQDNGYATDVVHDGEAGVQYGGTGTYDVIILDVMLPKADGFTVAQRLRRAHVSTPILLLTARDAISDKICGYDSGADDYMTKPFSPAELTARVDALMRRSGGSMEEHSGEISQPPFLLNTRNRTLEKNGQRVKLTQVEYGIVKLFMENPGKALSREEILDAVWGKDYFGELKIVDVNIRRLRIKIEDNPTKPTYVNTVWGYGYKWGS